MDSKLRSINRMLKNYDGDLVCKRDANGMIHVLRVRPKILGSFEFEGVRYHYSGPVEDYILSLTDNWKMEGSPVEWGLEPLLRKFRQMDSWRDDTGFERFSKSRERVKADEKRIKFNELKAAAADVRRDFAKSTNDFIVRQESSDKRYKSKQHF